MAKYMESVVVCGNWTETGIHTREYILGWLKEAQVHEIYQTQLSHNSPIPETSNDVQFNPRAFTEYVRNTELFNVLQDQLYISAVVRM